MIVTQHPASRRAWKAVRPCAASHSASLQQRPPRARARARARARRAGARAFCCSCTMSSRQSLRNSRFFSTSGATPRSRRSWSPALVAASGSSATISAAPSVLRAAPPPLAPPALLGALAAPTRPTFASASVQALFCAGFLRRRCATCRRAASSAPRGRQRGGHLLQTEMGISSNTSRQDTAAAFSFSLVTAPVLYTCGRRGERAVRLAPGARSRCRLSQRAVSLQALLAATPAPRSRPAGASPLLHLLQQCRQTAGQAEGAPV